MLGIELTPEAPVPEVVEYAKAATDSGFDTVFCSHHYNNRDEFAALAAIAGATEEVAIGPGITNPYETHPVSLASRMATLDELADGRGVFGVGAGDRSTLENLGFDHDNALRRVLETLRVSRRLWDGNRVDHDGTFNATDAGLNYTPGEIPVYVGAQGPHMTRMAAKYADGVLFNGSHPRDIEWAAERIEEGLAERDETTAGGPDRVTAFDFAAYASVSVAADADAARDAARPPTAFIAAGAPPPVLARHDIDQQRASEIQEAISAGEFTAAFEAVSDQMLDAFCVAGDPDAVTERLNELLETADSVVIGSPVGPDIGEALAVMDVESLSHSA
ncbi:5,10-methylenetetrahydromethanopterin reductase [Halovenus aranensis]|jgi:5,10-methylenetetrahydromethanopterin reductase|uniref:5,10-methylenetetrahydromethanopterin reductase n=1 Tax=Halovenus aranensis TaxID=890420 RepID=A0A1G8S1L4_9EURY|nr:5,10-methylenetetrahydromethanopterin reductase [Halovenus aranensis]SDJ23022.1 5,10-methylenetetrahydromethanopterin reductase [Halovenus aranensis]